MPRSMFCHLRVSPGRIAVVQARSSILKGLSCCLRVREYQRLDLLMFGMSMSICFGDPSSSAIDRPDDSILLGSNELASPGLV